MQSPAARSYTRLAIAIVVAAVLLSAALYATAGRTPKTTTSVATTTTETIIDLGSITTATGSGTATAATSSSPSSSLSVTSSTTTTGNAAAVTTTLQTQSTGPTANGSAAGWDSGLAVNATLNSPQVLGIVRSAYDYGVIGISSSPSDPSLISVLVNVTATQSVTGNWTTGYTVTDSGLTILNVTLRFTEPSTYSLLSVRATPLPDRTESLTFTPQQQEVIRVALSNGTVRGFMADYGVGSYYVPGVSQSPMANGTYGGDYYLSFSHIDGNKAISAYVNSAITQVVQASEAFNGGQVCYYPSGLCFDDPWNQTQ